MSKLQKLIQELCPDGVEYKTLGEIATIKNGRDYKHLGKGNVPVYGSGGIMTYVDTYVYNKPTVLIPRKGSLGNLFYVDTPFWNVDTIFYTEVDTQQIDVKYLYYLLAKEHLENLNKAGGVPSLTQSILNKIILPIPPLEVQNEIVRILDHFTDLAAEMQAELQAELQARKEQYEYYRNQLLTFDKIGGGTQSVTWMKMSEIGTFIRGKRFVRTDIVNDGIPCIHYGDIYTYYGLYATKSKGSLRSELASRMRYAQKNDVVIVAAGENKEDIGIGLAWLGEKPAAVHDACFIFRSDLYPQYISHYLRSNYYHKQIIKYVSEGKICSISAKGLGNAIIPIPSYEEQVRIATLLNNFDVLVSDLSQDLPAEIAAVQEQYEYYRNKILSFPRIRIGA
ncbi:restriction endonuclease subunit S [uncultured Phocaeicola sp.]|uniref:restriction endonuclease subunit S n=1 Tax=uncultured Phocaeicola sp. TaxID=990718 RepID=UPI0025E869D4|nr:restriction endonuclease subunit S [uncultured Phocaeicola sp.]